MALAQPVTRVQQAVITMILGLMASDVRHTHFLFDKVTVLSFDPLTAEMICGITVLVYRSFVLCLYSVDLLTCPLLQDFLLLVIRLLDSPSVVVRAKAFLAVQQLACNSSDMLLAACESR